MLKGIILAAALPLLALAWAADVSGTWEFTVVTDQGTGSPTFEFKQQGEKLTGTYSGMFGKSSLTGTVKGSDVEFTFEVPDLNGKVRYKGKIASDSTMKGDVDYGDVGSGKFTAKKK